MAATHPQQGSSTNGKSREGQWRREEVGEEVEMDRPRAEEDTNRRLLLSPWEWKEEAWQPKNKLAVDGDV